MKVEQEHLYELIIGQLLFDEYISIADQLFWAVQCSKNVMPDCELKKIIAKQYTNQLNENDDPCICGHPGPSCQPAASIKTRSIQSFKEKKSKHKTKHLKQHPGKLRTEASKEKKKRRKPKKSSQTEVDDVHKKDDESGMDGSSGKIYEPYILQDAREIEKDSVQYGGNEEDFGEDTEDPNTIKGNHRDHQKSESSTEKNIILKLNGSTFAKLKRKRGRPSRRPGKSVLDKHCAGLTHKGIANKLIKKAMREARKEPKGERKKKATMFMCNLCLTMFTMNGLKDHLKEHCTVSGEELRCLLCDKVLMCGNRILNFNSHLRLHGNMQHFLCSVCGKGFKTEGAYKYHREMHKDKRHTCEICQKSFKARGLLRSHLMTHSSIKSHICEYCAKGFRTATLLAKHVMIHTGEKPYRCDECGAKFRMSSHLRRHKDVHAGRKMYVCSVCNHAVYQRTNMRVHMKVHTGVRYSPIFVCSKCKMAFSSQEKLDEHSAGCRLTESAYEQQQRLGLQQKPAPLRVKRARHPKSESNSNNEWAASNNDPLSTNSLVPGNQSHSMNLADQMSQSLPNPPSAHQQLQLPGVLGNSGQQQTSQNLSGSGRPAPQHFTSGAQDLPQLQHQPQDIVHQQSQFLQLHAHQLYPQFYMQ